MENQEYHCGFPSICPSPFLAISFRNEANISCFTLATTPHVFNLNPTMYNKGYMQDAEVNYNSFVFIFCCFLRIAAENFFLLPFPKLVFVFKIPSPSSISPPLLPLSLQRYYYLLH
ncbi:hypothetical protein BCR33DRAFT_465282 [Rhizoclosmatium globosum]|uniref:Uncharacterized protein n=1 Tax=Rhizoclosmatium globosum TaxID=329046 RepID=A0A1Y2BQZ9_9FUNG|nr:hypothetical protein BCR33DRAFT_465282 [Rhizoclosmatium globosum]|eukprot:ORY37179.1 hypothetical protein BCR33DRAFT_465282 [Rhizoclosmatium globosum]